MRCTDDATECNAVMPQLRLFEAQSGVTVRMYVDKFSWKFSYSCIHCLLACDRERDGLRESRQIVEGESERSNKGSEETRVEGVANAGVTCSHRGVRKNNKVGRQRSAVQCYARFAVDVTTCSGAAAATVDL